MYGVKDRGGIKSRSTSIAHTDDNSFENNESLSMFKGFAFDQLWSDEPFAELATITVIRSVIRLC